MAGLVPPATLERIRAASDIVEVIGAHLPLKRAGANFLALCPFHREKTPSFNVSPQRQAFHCFGCHKGGDVFTFVREYENISFMEAVRRLAERARIPLELEASPGADRTRYVKETLLQIHEGIAQRWHNTLVNEAAGQPARDYLSGRGVGAEAIGLFRLGFAPEAWDDTVNWARSRDYDLAQVEQAGLVSRKESATHYYDRFRGRLMFPICDEQGRVIAFSGRVIAGDEKTAKYVNSPETPIFTKGRVLFGLDKSRRAIPEAGFAVVCEGQLDLIACYLAGVRNIVAPQGTAMTADHCRILKRYTDEVVLCFDSDTAGQNATLRVLDDLLASGLAIRVAAVPPPHDPDSFIRAHGAEAFRQLIAHAAGFFDFLLHRLCAENDLASDRGRLAVVRTMGETLRKTGNAVIVDAYVQKTAQRLGVGADALRAEFKRLRAAGPSASSPSPAPAPASCPAPDLPPRTHPERWLMKLLLIDEHLVDWAAAHLDLAWVQHPLVRRVIERRLAAHREGAWRDVGALLGEFSDEPALQTLIAEDSVEEREIPDRGRQLIDSLTRLRNLALDRQAQLILQRVADPQVPEADRAALVSDLNRLKNAKHEPLKPLDEAPHA